jgi:predicted RNA-binding Zn-ribbon protein involved in translation (DUF1610 family)
LPGKGGAGSLAGTMDFGPLTWTILALVVLAGGGGFLFFRSRTPKEEPYFHFKCPGCGRKLRYRAKQAGHSGQCRNCNQKLTFPTPTPAERRA